MKASPENTRKTVLISGAAGGLGSELVKIYAEKGYRVFATDINREGLQIYQALENVRAIPLDITNIEQTGLFAKELNTEIDGLDILICLAGAYDIFPVTEAGPGLLKNMMEVNVLGASSLIQAFLLPLIKNQGRVIVVSSESYRIQAMFQPYMISKASLEAYCRVARQELALKGVRLSVIRPGAIDTGLLKWMKSSVNTMKYPVYSDELIRSWEQSTKMVGHITPAEKVAFKIFKVSIARKPAWVYRINNSFLLTVISIIPVSLFDLLIIKIFKARR